MNYKILLKAAIKKHKWILTGIFILTLLVSISLGAVLTVWTNSASYISNELNRAGFGTLTAWISGAPNTYEIVDEIADFEIVERVEVQQLVFSNYIINGQESDSEGQLLTYAPHENRYRIFEDNLSQYRLRPSKIEPGEVYVSPSLISMFGVKLGDTISFPIARNGGNIDLTVKGFYEDPVMGSSMIGMKGFLVSAEDTITIHQIIRSANLDALARIGSMLHIFSDERADTTVAQLSSMVNQNTDLSEYTEFVHSAEAISGFMLILQKAFSGLLIAFVLVLLFVVLVALGHGITSNIEEDYTDMGILKSMGFTSTKLRQIQMAQYAVAIVPGMLFGIIFTEPVSRLIASATLTTTGVMIPANLPWALCIPVFAVILGIIYKFIVLKTTKIKNITPISAISGETENVAINHVNVLKIRGNHLNLSLAVRQLMTGRKRYISACLVAIFLVFFASMIGRMDTWIGADGKGMMDAFNPADHHIGVQLFGNHTLEEAQEITETYTDITDSYQLAMVNASVNGIDYTANVITEPNRFHILDGETSTANDEIVVTEFVAADLGVSIGDKVTVAGDNGSGEYVISGIYSCANDMGDNIGMSREGYLQIAQDNPQIWCDHYFLADTSSKDAIITALTGSFGGDVHVHENTWPGLNGIISAMRALVIFMYAMVVLFILIITTMTASKLLAAEQQDMNIYKAMGFTVRKLRLSFALRFGIVAVIGSIIGLVLSTALTDLLVSNIMKFAGISNFASNPSLFTIAFPAIVVTLLFLVFAYLAAGKIKRARKELL